jgi:hypothetical protein
MTAAVFPDVSTISLEDLQPPCDMYIVPTDTTCLRPGEWIVTYTCCGNMETLCDFHYQNMQTDSDRVIYFYECDRCNRVIDSDNLFAHAERI